MFKRALISSALKRNVVSFILVPEERTTYVYAGRTRPQNGTVFEYAMSIVKATHSIRILRVGSRDEGLLKSTPTARRIAHTSNTSRPNMLPMKSAATKHGALDDTFPLHNSCCRGPVPETHSLPLSLGQCEELELSSCISRSLSIIVWSINKVKRSTSIQKNRSRSWCSKKTHPVFRVMQLDLDLCVVAIEGGQINPIVSTSLITVLTCAILAEWNTYIPIWHAIVVSEVTRSHTFRIDRGATQRHPGSAANCMKLHIS